ncbi:MAG: EAL domain-containing protein [Pseudomonadota bacterium]
MENVLPLEPAVLLTGPTGKIVQWNAGCQALTGYPEQAVMHQPMALLLAPSARAMMEQHRLDAAHQPRVVAAELIDAAGQVLAARIGFVPQYDKADRLSGHAVLLLPEEDGRRRVSGQESEPCGAPDAAPGDELSCDLAGAPEDGPARQSEDRAEAEAEAEAVGNVPLKKVMDLIAGPFSVSTRDGRYVLWNRHVEMATQLSPQELRDLHIPTLFHESERGETVDKMHQVLDLGLNLRAEVDVYDKQGKQIPYLISFTRLMCKNKAYLVAMGIDITERRRQEAVLRLRERALHASSNGIVITRCCGKDNPIEYVNLAFERLTGYSAQESIGRDPRFMAAPGLDVEQRRQLRLAVDQLRAARVVFRNKRKDGSIFWHDLAITPVQDEHGVTTHFIGVSADVTDLKNRTDHLEHRVNRDPLTGLANRNLLWDRLEQALHFAQRNKSLVAVLLLDLNDFKFINDSMGHEAGDEVLKVVAKRLQASVRDSDTVARLSGDEFVLVLANQPSLRFTMRMVDRLRHCIAKPLAYAEREISIGASIGVSVFPHDGSAAFDLVRAADVAMYHSKAGGKGDVHFFSADMKTTTEAKRVLEECMRKALDNDEVFMLYQPRRSLKDARITGVEALLRWRHPERGVLLPADFLGQAEESGFIVPLGQWVLDHVCQLMRRLSTLGHGHVQVSMNASYREFSQRGYIAKLADKLDRFDLPHAQFELELREDHLMRNLDLSKKVVDSMKELGITLALDEFCAGSINLSYLQDLPVSHVKLSRRSVKAISSDERSAIMVRTAIDIGHNLNIGVVAEGVETAAQLDFLQRHGCDEIQGNFFQKPLALDQLETLLAEKN